MAGEWSTMTLLEAGVKLIDCDHRTPPAAADGYPYVAIPQLKRGRVDLSDVRRITREHLVEWTRRAKPTTNDVILSRRCNPGETAVCPPDVEFALGQNLVLLRSDATRVYPPFLRWLVRGPEWWNQIGKFINVGAVFDSLRCADVPKFELLFPPLPAQRAIAHILGTLDDKIELNRRMNETLEAMARALFNSWFADTDPVRAKVDDLAKEGVLEIGDGYRAKNSELGGPGLPFIRGGDLNNGFDTAGAEILNQTSVAKAGNKISREGDVAFTSKGTIGRFARVNAHTEKFVYSPQVCYWRSLDFEKLNPTVLYCWMTSGELLTQILAISGQTDMAPYASLRDQRAMEVPLFTESQHELAFKVEPLLSRQALLATESKTLTALRDTLLPKLISGELRVKAAEKIVEAVA